VKITIQSVRRIERVVAADRENVPCGSSNAVGADLHSTHGIPSAVDVVGSARGTGQAVFPQFGSYSFEYSISRCCDLWSLHADVVLSNVCM
jgi:hypothetical protein